MIFIENNLQHNYTFTCACHLSLRLSISTEKVFSFSFYFIFLFGRDFFIRVDYGKIARAKEAARATHFTHHAPQ